MKNKTTQIYYEVYFNGTCNESMCESLASANSKVRVLQETNRHGVAEVYRYDRSKCSDYHEKIDEVKW